MPCSLAPNPLPDHPIFCNSLKPMNNEKTLILGGKKRREMDVPLLSDSSLFSTKDDLFSVSLCVLDELVPSFYI
uniref:Uncharacterized protein n=1 Tax=Romanomermis culicivorax TaxID=13658 RepID=A0A915HL42_ROMCU